MLRPVVHTILFSFLFFLFVHAGEKINLYAMPSYAGVIITYMTLMTCGVIALIQRQPSPVLFSQAYLASIVFKILTSLGVILVLIRIDPAGANANAALFILSYIAFTALEVALLLKWLSSQRK